MKTGLSLQQLAAEVERRADQKRDYVAPAGKLSMVAETERGRPVIGLNLRGIDTYPLARYAHGQVAEWLGIPRKYYDRMLEEAPGLLAINANRWLEGQGQQGTARMVRTLDGQVRAVLSDRYRALENEDLARAVLPVLGDLGIQVLSSDITETRMYLKGVHRDITRDVPTGKAMGDSSHTVFDTISPAITISNSEVGAGALAIVTSVWTHACTNLAGFGAQVRKAHVGGRADVAEEVYAMLTDQTRELTDAAVWAQVRDVTRAAFDEAQFEARAQKLSGAARDEIRDDPIQVLDRAAKRFTLGEGEKQGILQHLIRGGDLTRYGLHAAVTRASADVESYDRATELEAVGGQIIDLPGADWQRIAQTDRLAA